MLDTGAASLVADADVAKAAGGVMAKKIDASGVGGGRIDAWKAQGLSLRLDGLDALFPVENTATLNRTTKPSAHRIGVLVGGDFMRRYAVEIDYPNALVRIYDPNDYVPRIGMMNLPLRFVDGKPVAELTVQLPGDTPRKLSAEVDTGSAGVRLTGAYVRREDLLARYPKAEPFSGAAGFAGAAPGRWLDGVEATFGTQDFSGPILLDTSKDGTTGAKAEIDAIIGGEVLRSSVVAFEYGKARMSRGYFPSTSG